MSYEEMLRRLLALRRFGMRPGLDGVRALLGALGDPHEQLRVVHVGGTNGKGSTAAMIEAALRADGRRTGLYTSPHLLRFTERIRIDGVEIARARVAALAERVFAVGGEHTFFEIATAMGFLAFAEAGVDVAVVEVGLGGRLDSTNVVERPLVTLVTSIGLDHTDVLGPTLVDVAREKAGIFKRGRPALFAADTEAAAVLQAEAERVGASPIERYGREFNDASLPQLALAGFFQRRNAALARRALEILGVSADAIADGFAHVKWPGRLERLSPTVLVDAAHNVEGARALAAAVPGPGPITLIIGVVADKDARAIIENVAKIATRVIATRPPSPRALPPSELARLWPGAEVADDLATALAMAAGEQVVVAGSIFLVGEARRLVLGEAADPMPVQDPVGQKL